MARGCHLGPQATPRICGNEHIAGHSLSNETSQGLAGRAGPALASLERAANTLQRELQEKQVSLASSQEEVGLRGSHSNELPASQLLGF